jgi:hypothetical protein
MNPKEVEVQFYPLGEVDSNHLKIEGLVVGFDGLGMDWLNNSQEQRYGRVVEAIVISKAPVTAQSQVIGIIKTDQHRTLVITSLGEEPVEFIDLPLAPDI